jgi:hypothetical protein
VGALVRRRWLHLIFKTIIRYYVTHSFSAPAQGEITEI